MELNNAFGIIEKHLTDKNNSLGFKRAKSEENELLFTGDKGAYRLVYDNETDILQFECSHEYNEKDTQWSMISKSLFEPDVIDERGAKSVANEIADEMTSLFASKKKADLDKIKMPKSVSRSKAKNGINNYDTASLANRFGVLYPDMKDQIKLNIAAYGEFLPETFFVEYGTPRVLDVIKNGNEADRKKLFKMLNEVYEDGTNEVQDIIGVTILGEMKGAPELLEVADRYMDKYMADPVHEINKLTKKNGKLMNKLQNPPAYKPKKKKANVLQNALNAQPKQ